MSVDSLFQHRLIMHIAKIFLSTERRMMGLRFAGGPGFFPGFGRGVSIPVRSSSVLFEPTDMSKAKKIWTSGQVTYTSPNLGELLAMYDAISGEKTTEDLKALSHAPVERLLAYITDLAVVVAERVPNLLISLGPAGLLVTRRARDHADMFTSRDKLSEDTSHVVAVHYPTIPDIPVLSVSGAGDCMVGAMVASILRHHPPDIVCKAGLKCAHQSLASYFTVPPEMTSLDYTPETVATWAGRMEGHVVPVNGRGKSKTARTLK